jgi:hypothetical protein
MKKDVKKVAVVEVWRVPSAFDDDSFAEPIQKGFSSWPFLRCNFHEHCTPGSENEFVDTGSVQMLLPKLPKKLRHLMPLLRLLILNPLVAKMRHLPSSQKSLK